MRNRTRYTFAFCLVTFLTACQFGVPPHPYEWDQVSPQEQRSHLVEDAQDLGHVRRFQVGERSFPMDCSGYVGAVLYRNGIDVFKGANELQIRGNGVVILHTFVSRYGELFADTPSPGDLVFFDNTYDRNHDGKWNDRLTHVGIVEEVDEDGTITYLHHARGGVQRYTLNLRFPRQHEDASGREINSYLRRSRGRSGPETLSAALFQGYATLIRSPMNLTDAGRSSKESARE